LRTHSSEEPLEKGRAPMKARVAGVSIIFLTIILATGLVLMLPGCGGTKSVNDIWQKMLQADQTIKSMNMNIAMYYENTKFGSGQIEGTSIDISGDDVHLQKWLFGQDFLEVIRVGGKQYSRSMGSDKWTEVPLTLSNQTYTAEGQIGNLPNVASASENLGLETVDGKSAYHLTFTLPPEGVGSVFSSVSAAELAQNKGAKVDVWVDKDTNFTLKYEALINNVLITDKIGYADRRITNTITKINEVITISSPV
jgi:hypothetical protein